MFRQVHLNILKLSLSRNLKIKSYKRINTFTLKKILKLLKSMMMQRMKIGMTKLN